MRNWMNRLLLLLFTLLLAPAAHAAADASKCLECHGAMEGSIKVEQNRFSKSVHGAMDDCTMCHMALKGDQHQGLSGSKPDKTVQDIASAVSHISKVDSVAQAACVNCHSDAYESYRASVHGINVMQKKSADGPVCSSCHGSPHYIQPKSSKESSVNHFNVVASCGVCHEETKMAEKYGFTEKVMERYKESFHGRKLKLGHAGAPSCVSCHGSHNVKSAKDPGAPVVGQNKIETCAKCHSGANERFTAAITHKPLHPIAHYTELALILLTMGVFAFICSHVLLDIYADIRDRLFRKGDKHE